MEKYSHIRVCLLVGYKDGNAVWRSKCFKKEGYAFIDRQETQYLHAMQTLNFLEAIPFSHMRDVVHVVGKWSEAD